MSPVAFVVLKIEGSNELTRNIDKLINGSLNEEPCAVSRRKVCPKGAQRRSEKKTLS